ncbi:MAG: hypothetical protein JO336_10115 [Acidobacteriia bacterium]|nr:hypothetical protein [Terriglobia bacterium]MBV8906305.1 hypothetical protein [Terriglobia bacterium]
MTEQPTNGDAALLEVGIALGQNLAFGLVAGRCSAAQAEALRRIREERLYKRCAETWLEFCPKYLKISKTEADRTIKILEEFGPAYFELSQLARISPEAFRAIAPNIQDGILHCNGEAIELNSGNYRKVAAAVAELRRAIPKRGSEIRSLMREVNELCHETDLSHRIEKLNKCASVLIAEFENIASDQGLGITRIRFNSVLMRVRQELTRVAMENGIAN